MGESVTRSFIFHDDSLDGFEEDEEDVEGAGIEDGVV